MKEILFFQGYKVKIIVDRCPCYLFNPKFDFLYYATSTYLFILVSQEKITVVEVKSELRYWEENEGFYNERYL